MEDVAVREARAEVVLMTQSAATAATRLTTRTRNVLPRANSASSATEPGILLLCADLQIPLMDHRCSPRSRLPTSVPFAFAMPATMYRPSRLKCWTDTALFLPPSPLYQTVVLKLQSLDLRNFVSSASTSTTFLVEEWTF